MSGWIRDAISVRDQVPEPWLLDNPDEREGIERVLTLRMTALVLKLVRTGAELLGPYAISWRQLPVEGREYDTVSICEIRQAYRRKVAR